MLVQYFDGVGEDDDLHSRGCRVKVFRRKVDMEEMCENVPLILCPFGGEDEECTCMRCQTGKWPERYSSWNMAEQQISEAKLIAPNKEKSGWRITL